MNASPFDKQHWQRVTVGVLAVTAVTAGILFAMGRHPWCACGSPIPWSWDIWSSHNSQHILDAYSFTHMLHGVLFWGLFAGLFRFSKVQESWKLALIPILSVALEGAWEVAENTDAIINKYRETATALDYFGDSIGNSIADLGFCLLGTFYAMRVPLWVSILTFVAVEAVLMGTIRDSLILSSMSLVYPIEAVQAWQAGN